MRLGRTLCAGMGTVFHIVRIVKVGGNTTPTWMLQYLSNDTFAITQLICLDSNAQSA